jgi:hypothetical protein
MTKESFKINGENLLKKVKELIAEGNIRKISIHDKDGKEIMSFPLTVGVVGALLAPVLAAVGAVAALVGECTITVEKEE